MPTRADVVKRWPALDAVKMTEEWDAALADAIPQVDDGVWGDKAELGRIHLAAHLLAVSHPEVFGTPTVASETVGPISRTYAVAAISTDPETLAGSPYGKAFLRLRRMVGAFGIMAV